MDGIGSLEDDTVDSVEEIVGGNERAEVFSELVCNIEQMLEIFHYCCSRH